MEPPEKGVPKKASVSLRSGRTVATRNMARIAVGKLRKLQCEFTVFRSSLTFQKNFMPTIAYTDMSSISKPPTCTIEAKEAATVSKIAFMPRRAFTVRTNLKSFMVTRETRATLMTLAFILSDAAEAMETATTRKSMTLFGSLKYLFSHHPVATNPRIGTHYSTMVTKKAASPGSLGPPRQ